jgi:hypothetical protein
MKGIEIINEVLNECYTNEHYELDEVIEKLEKFKEINQVKNPVVLADVGEPIDTEIAEKLNDFSKIAGTKEPKNNRF